MAAAIPPTAGVLIGDVRRHRRRCLDKAHDRLVRGGPTPGRPRRIPHGRRTIRVRVLALAERTICLDNRPGEAASACGLQSGVSHVTIDFGLDCT